MMYFFLLFVLLLTSCQPKSVVVVHIVDIRIAFGYKDTRPTRFVGDRYERLYIIQDLVQDCTSKKTFACGFSRDEKDGDLLSRSFKLSETNLLTVKIRITPSSVGPDDEMNRSNPYQSQQSLIAENNLISGLHNANGVFYVGHSRDGGGPDFGPPKILGDKDVDYRWYREHKPGFKTVLSAIGESASREHQVFGMMSCLSSKHFEKSIESLTKRISFVSTHKLIYYTEALNETLSEVSKLIGEQLKIEQAKSLSATASRTSAPKTFSF